jgi:hypothetical protein
MREVYDYYGHPLLDEVEAAVSQLVHLLDRHGYSDKALYVAQECLWDELIALEAAARDYKDQAQQLRAQAAMAATKAKESHGEVPQSVRKSTKKLYQEAEQYEEARRVLQYGRWLLRYVGDGIAWHAFGHNRRIIRALASKERVQAIGDPETDAKVRMIFRGVRRLGRDWLPLLHDLTNCLRTADLSAFQGGQLIRMSELKIRRSGSDDIPEDHQRAYRSSRERRQQERLDRIFRFLRTRDLGDLDPSLAGGRALDSKVGERHHFDAVSSAMVQARQNGYGFESPEPGVIYIAWDVAKDSVDDALNAAQAEHPRIVSSGFTFRSISARYEAQHQGLPITAMAIGADDILDILLGRIGVIALINFDELEAYCAGLGVPVKIRRAADGGFSIVVEIEGVQGEVLEGLWDRVMLEALSVESLCGLIRSIMDSRSSEVADGSA